MSADHVAPVPKVDPETLVLRNRPPRAIRFRRGLIIGIAALGSASLMGLTWMALRPQLTRSVAQESELSAPSRPPTADELAKLPTGYGDVPKLGPPLPGDLGRPILRAQQEREGRDMSGESDLMLDAERQAAIDALRAARRSPLLIQSSGRAGASSSSVPGEAPASLQAAYMRVGPQERFEADLDAGPDINPHLPSAPSSPYVLTAGSIIAASLITGLNSDLPGMAIAQVSQSVFDSSTGRILLIPQGARLIGRYDNKVGFGQRRVQIVWERIMLPDGGSLRLDNMPATDAAGRAGLSDQVDRHAGGLLGAAVISTLLGVGGELALDGEGRLIGAIREGSQQSIARAGDQLVGKQIDVQPTLIIRAGAPVRLLVQRDLILSPWKS